MNTPLTISPADGPQDTVILDEDLEQFVCSVWAEAH